jgi:hypothetical protein
MTTLSERALLVSLNVSQWNGRKLDKNETSNVAHRTGAVRGAARVNKDLLPGVSSLQRVQKLTGDIRTFVYKRTAPWAEGTQIMQSAGYLDFMQDFGQLRREWEQAVDTFVQDYPQLQAMAQQSLGTLFDPADYPDATTLRERFSLDVRFLPVPNAADWRVDLGDEAIADLRADVERQVKAGQDAAMRAVFERIYDVAQKAHERLSDPKAIFRDSLVENAVQLCDVLPSLNITGDKRVDALRKVLQTSLGKYNPSTLRKDAVVRKKTADAMKQVMDKMGAFMGAPDA